MSQLVECVPNFSEGQSKEVVEAIAGAIVSTPGCNLLDVDPGLSTNRTVFTFVGSPSAVIEGALTAAKAAYQLIDMTRHKGEHPRIGALDVCPFIPLRGVTMEECEECAKTFGELLASQLHVPVYLYGSAAKGDHRQTLPQIRAGEYEGIAEKIGQDEWKPDFGPAEFIPTWGATVTGARKFLIAYNINVLATKEQAHRIALNIREQGRGKEEPGRLKHVQGMGWWLDEANLAQISVNILDHDVTPIHEVYEECLKDAQEMKVGIAGSQIVGLVPLDALLQVADHYIKKESLFVLEDQQKIRLAVNRLGLSTISPFLPKERIIEYMVDEDKDGPLITMDLKSFIMSVGSRTPSPGGGTVAALSSTLGAALASMVGLLSYGNRRFEHLDDSMRELIPQFYNTSKTLSDFIDSDAAAFADYMVAMKLQKDTAENAEKREELMQVGLKNAVAVPMNVAMVTNRLWTPLKKLAETGNYNCKSDLEVAAKSLETGVFGAKCNVLTNLSDIKDDEYTSKAKEDVLKEWEAAQEACRQVLDILDNRTAE